MQISPDKWFIALTLNGFWCSVWLEQAGVWACFWVLVRVCVHDEYCFCMNKRLLKRIIIHLKALSLWWFVKGRFPALTPLIALRNSASASLSDQTEQNCLSEGEVAAVCRTDDDDEVQNVISDCSGCTFLICVCSRNRKLDEIKFSKAWLFIGRTQKLLWRDHRPALVSKWSFIGLKDWLVWHYWNKRTICSWVIRGAWTIHLHC